MKRLFKIFTTATIVFSVGSAIAQEQKDTFCLQNQAIYQQRYKNENTSKNFTPETFKAWRNLFFNCPTASKNMYVPHGVSMFTALYNKEKDAAVKKQYLDTIMMIYDRRIQYFGEESNYIGKKGADLFLLDPAQYEQAYEYCKKSVDAMGNNAEAKTMVICLQTAVTKYQKGSMSKTDVIALYQQIADIFTYNIEKKTKNGQACEKQLANIEQLFLSVKPDCNDLVALFEPQFKADLTNVALLKKITDNMGKDCASTDLYFNAAVELDKLEPSAQSKRAIGDMYVAKKQVSKALEYYKESVELETDNDKKANVYYKMAYNTSGPTSVSYAHKALALNPNMGSAYLVIANKYAEGVNGCASGAEFPELEKWKVYWVAYDMCQKAKAVDPSIASQANSYAASFKARFPDVEALFGYNVTEGASQNVGCWINMTTTAKVK